MHFLWAKGLSTEEVHREMHPVYDENCLSRKAVFNWIQEFNKEWQSIRDREQSSRSVEVSTVQHVEHIICNDRHVTTDDIACAVDCLHGTAYNIMHEQLKFLKVFIVGGEFPASCLQKTK